MRWALAADAGGAEATAIATAIIAPPAHRCRDSLGYARSM
jgi:hypothetical protein